MVRKASFWIGNGERKHPIRVSAAKRRTGATGTCQDAVDATNWTMSQFRYSTLFTSLHNQPIFTAAAAAMLAEVRA